jgi:hypothetical protein
MCFFARIRALLTLLVLAHFSPLALATHQSAEQPVPTFGGGQLGISLFIARRTRVAATEQFEPTRAAIVRLESGRIEVAGGVPIATPVKTG